MTNAVTSPKDVVLPILMPPLDPRRVITPAEAKRRTWERLTPEFKTARQALGQRTAIGCVSLEITQRCNLDCTLCYLSDMSESTLDVPMEELRRRIDEILYAYGPYTSVQVSGGDPTLRKESELIEIVAYITARNMHATLLTNGIKATRDLLTKLAAAGLTDVAFHVDMTENLRKPDKTYYTSESELNVIRKEYIERARGLGVAVIFNTTLCETNFHELPVLVNFFKENADVVGMCSFQLGAETGRGEVKGRPDSITPANIIRIINETLNPKRIKGDGRDLNFEATDIGHPDCNRIGYAFITNNTAYDLWWDPDLFNRVAKDFEGVKIDRRYPSEAIKTIAKHVLTHPKLLVEALRFLSVHLWRMGWNLAAGGFKVHKLSYFMHNFMHADALDQCRLQNCSFMVMTSDGPIAMCEHNAQRDLYITKAFEVKKAGGAVEVFNPVRETKRAYWEEKKPEVEALATKRIEHLHSEVKTLPM
ncbi:MAG: radical SAM protein [Rhizobacter sp.]|nr:radical SAM protein [Chlorobiales bacterium]